MVGRTLEPIEIDEFHAPALIQLLDNEMTRLKEVKAGHRDRWEKLEWARVGARYDAIHGIWLTLTRSLRQLGPPSVEDREWMGRIMQSRAQLVPRSKANAASYRREKAAQRAEREARRAKRRPRRRSWLPPIVADTPPSDGA